MKQFLVGSLGLLVLAQSAFAVPVCKVTSHHEPFVHEATYSAHYGSGEDYNGVWSRDIEDTIAQAVKWRELGLCRKAYFMDKCSVYTHEIPFYGVTTGVKIGDDFVGNFTSNYATDVVQQLRAAQLCK